MKGLQLAHRQVRYLTADSRITFHSIFWWIEGKARENDIAQPSKCPLKGNRKKNTVVQTPLRVFAHSWVHDILGNLENLWISGCSREKENQVDDTSTENQCSIMRSRADTLCIYLRWEREPFVPSSLLSLSHGIFTQYSPSYVSLSPAGKSYSLAKTTIEPLPTCSLPTRPYQWLTVSLPSGWSFQYLSI